MQRIINKRLNAWKESIRRRPLILRGARQVGKTYSVIAFGQAEFDEFVTFDFELDRSLHRIFEGDLRPEKLLMELEAHCRQRIIPGKTLVFFDEIQACPRALMSLRYFYEQKPQLHLIAAGSLLEFAMADQSFPVGRVEFEWMRPMCFAEFLRAIGEELLIEHLPTKDTTIAVAASIHEKLLEQLRIYFLVGGMPEAVQVFRETRSIAEVTPIHKLLCNSYIEDFAKYGPRVDRECVEHIFRSIPQWVGRQTKYRPLYPEKSIPKIKECLRLLEKSLIIHKVRSCNANGLPLGAEASDKLFKCVFLDIGLMQHLCGILPAEVLSTRDLLDNYRGALAEQFIGQELLAGASSENEKLYYWSRQAQGSSAEVDYIIVRDGKIIPIEVKSGPAGKLKSLHLFMRKHPDCSTGLILSSREIDTQSQANMQFLPLYTKL